jgi:hypothetical protein
MSTFNTAIPFALTIIKAPLRFDGASRPMLEANTAMKS